MIKVKLVAKPNVWFKEGTEVLSYYNEPIAMAEWLEAQEDEIIYCRGTRVCESITGLHEVGEEYEDGETCLVEEFDWEFVDG